MKDSLFFIHIMKTGGTSLRNMIINNLGEQIVYPTNVELKSFPKNHYPSSKQIISGIDKIRDHKILIGHYPYELLNILKKKQNYKVVTFLREPINRTISMMNHRMRSSPEFANKSFEELLDNAIFVNNQILNYQTKVFSMDIGEVNEPFNLTGSHLKKAISNLKECTFVGLNEHFDTSCILFDKTFDTSLARQIRHDNTSKKKVELEPSLLHRIEKLLNYDILFYNEATKIFQDKLNKFGVNYSVQ